MSRGGFASGRPTSCSCRRTWRSRRRSSTSIKNVGGDKYEIAGKLTLKGVTKDVVVPIALKKDATGNNVAEGSFPLKRVDYKIGEGMWSDTEMVADDVVVRIRMVLPPVA